MKTGLLSRPSRCRVQDRHRAPRRGKETFGTTQQQHTQEKELRLGFIANQTEISPATDRKLVARYAGRAADSSTVLHKSKSRRLQW